MLIMEAFSFCTRHAIASCIIYVKYVYYILYAITEKLQPYNRTILQSNNLTIEQSHNLTNIQKLQTFKSFKILKGNSRMKKYSFSEMNRSSGDILDAALAEPVALTKRGKDKLIIITTEMWEKMKNRVPAKAYTLDNLPENSLNQLMGGLDEIIQSSPK